MIFEAFENAGGVQYLVTQAKKNPTAFMGLLGKIVPAEVHATIKREIAELTRDDLYAIAGRARAAAEDGCGEQSPQVH